MARRPPLGGLFLSFPFLPLTFVASSKLLPLIEFIPLSWGLLLISPTGVDWLLRDSIKKRRETFLAIYLSLGTITTLLGTLVYITSLQMREIVGVALITAFVMSIFVAFLLIARRGEKRNHGEFSQDLTSRLGDLVGERKRKVPGVYICPIGTLGINRIKANETMGNAIFIERNVVEMLSQEEMDGMLAHWFHIARSRLGTLAVLGVFMIVAIEADLFGYFLIGGSPDYGVIMVPVTGILLILDIFLIPIMLMKLHNIPLRWADRFAIKKTGNPEALKSALLKLESARGSARSVPDSKLAKRIFKKAQKDNEGRLARIR